MNILPFKLAEHAFHPALVEVHADPIVFKRVVLQKAKSTADGLLSITRRSWRIGSSAD